MVKAGWQEKYLPVCLSSPSCRPGVVALCVEAGWSFGCSCESACRFGGQGRNVLEATLHRLVQQVDARERAAMNNGDDELGRWIAAREGGRLDRVAEVARDAGIHQFAVHLLGRTAFASYLSWRSWLILRAIHSCLAGGVVVI